MLLIGMMKNPLLGRLSSVMTKRRQGLGRPERMPRNVCVILQVMVWCSDLRGRLVRHLWQVPALMQPMILVLGGRAEESKKRQQIRLAPLTMAQPSTSLALDLLPWE